MSELVLRSATEDDFDALVTAQQSAFADEAVVGWVTANSDRSNGLGGKIVGLMVREILTEDELIIAVDAGRIVGLSMWQDLDSARRPRSAAGELAALGTGDAALERVAVVHRTVAEQHPDLPHLYLASMGVIPECRGRGIGGALLRHRLAEADVSGLPAYLEASTTRSRDLYARHGFTEHGSPIALPAGGPELYPMWRDAGR
ncbi:MAG: GNAT family N-acetyltransferase [Stackebrandtia sp.]